jgi:uncharacterized protein YggU (UPF0235/DUF167 family)
MRASTPKPARLDVVVKPGSKQPGISFEGDTLVLRVRERAIEGAANAACIRALAEYYAIAPSNITLIRGAKSRKKAFKLSPH